MTDPGMFSAEDRQLTESQDLDHLDGMPRQGRGAVIAQPAEFALPAESAELRPETGSAPTSDDPEATERKLPLLAAVLLADLALAVVTVIVLAFVGVQKLGSDATLAERRTVHVEDLVIFFVVGAIFTGVAVLLYRSRQNRVAIVQAVLAVVVLGVGVVAAVNGNPSASSVVTPVAPDDSPEGGTIATATAP